jgi:hypothetical protein
VTLFDVPQLKVGTLDGLLSLTDELSRADSSVEGVVKRVERAVTESYVALRLAEMIRKAPAGAEVPTAASVPALGLRCAGRPI